MHRNAASSRRGWAFALAGMASLAGCDDRSSEPPAARAAARESINWSGYVLTGAPGQFRSVSGSWAVPAVTCGAEDTASATWTGIGGGTTEDPTLIQAGTFQDCFDGAAEYSAWWEAIPAPAVNAGGGPLDEGSFPVQPGDHIVVTIDGSDLTVWRITIQNTTRNATFETTVPYGSAGATAEWVEEAPVSAGTGGAGFTTLADYGSVGFEAITANGANPQLTPEQAIVMVDGDGNVISNPSPPDANGDSFRVCYGPEACE
jgi:hypothetical protein